MIEKARRKVDQLVHNPWAMLMAWVALIGLIGGGIATFYNVDKRVVRNTERYEALTERTEQRAYVVDQRLDRFREDANEDRTEIRDTLDQVNSKLDEINRYLRDNPRGNHAPD